PSPAKENTIMHSRFTNGRQAATDFDPTRAFDWTRHNSNGPAVAGRRGGAGQAMDAAASSGYTFLQSALELIEPKLVEPLQAVTHERDLPIKLGGGFPE